MSDDPASTEAFKWEQRMEQIERLLTPFGELGDIANDERRVAALTIKNLMEEVEGWQQAMQKAERDMLQLRQQLKELRGERDEARREVCKLKAWNVQERLGPEGYALLRKWDCFARDTSEHL